MSKEDSHSISFDLHGAIGSTNRILIFFPKDYEVWALHFEDYVLGIETRGSSIQHAIDVGPYIVAKTQEVVKSQKRFQELVEENVIIFEENICCCVT